MTPFERKVVHDAVAAAGLRSESEGEEPDRRVVVLPGSWPLVRRELPMPRLPVAPPASPAEAAWRCSVRRCPDIGTQPSWPGPGVDRGLLGPAEAERLWDRHLLNCAA